MSPLALALVLGAAVFHSTWNLALKSEPRRLEASLIALAASVVLSAPVLLVHGLGEVSAGAWALVLLSGAFETAYLLTLTAAYEAGDLSLVYPIARGSAPLVVVPLAALVLGERPSPSGLGGIALIVAGILVTHAELFRSAATAGARRAAAFAALTGVMIAGYSLVNKVGVGTVPVLLWAFLVQTLDALLLLLVLRARGRLEWPRAGAPRGRAAAIGVLMLASYLAVLTALTLAPVSYVVAGREVSIVVSALAGVLLLHERHSSRRIAGAVVIFAGLLVLAFSR
ncbi:MAG TPA: DMT family transporter [Candidatus Acidoferrum sp.]|nr:DMT family transporter [Candidatus Acidoferrum sp.]